MTSIRRNRTYLITGAANRIGRGLARGLPGKLTLLSFITTLLNPPHSNYHKKLPKWGARHLQLRQTSALPLNARNYSNGHGIWPGPIDVLINNASIFEEGRLAEITIDDINRNMMINAYAPLLLSRSFVELNKNRKSAALPVIINMLDSRITDYDRQHAAYHMAKRTLFTLTKMMALEFAPAVRVNAVAPGLILPPRGKDQSYLEQLKILQSS